ncbi:hypothetical protein CC1G_05730 [Coprinopsis cinerea okayama7|uniref:Uncharacterized protein n=1 Tax=Coprinopsis cinerea (strain Okayama-7 / 130 / ATCC MYA-4618 / FGSC 9003) TaxID=240176 RepID=A8NA03_COPC7|nr:hypothetical protein CC1G_05730 [Coprinopsis cinerea okayama7\|eukprot:XP_001831659.1 hypothetical protein CC1G_05730 [Coprinopsis cinerea okayama7\
MNILTSFPFTFKLTVPGLSNPFTSLTTTPSPTSSKNIPIPPGDPPLDRPSRSLIRPTRPLPISVTAPTPMSAPGSRTMRPPRPSFSPSPSPTPSSALSLTQTYSHLGPRPHFVHSLSPSPAPINRKRGWEPSCSPTTSETTLTLTNGYLDTPAKYRELTGGMEREAEHIQGVRELDEDVTDDGDDGVLIEDYSVSRSSLLSLFCSAMCLSPRLSCLSLLATTRVI